MPKSEKMSDEDHGDLLDLLVAKEKELQRGLEVAAEQEELNEQIKQTKALMDERDGEIRLLHRRLLTAEATLMESLFEARKKMEAVNAAKKKPVPTEDIIKYAYRYVDVATGYSSMSCSFQFSLVFWFIQIYFLFCLTIE